MSATYDNLLGKYKSKYNDLNIVYADSDGIMESGEIEFLSCGDCDYVLNSFVFTTVISERVYNNTSPHSTEKQCELIEHRRKMFKVHTRGSNINIDDDDVLYSNMISKPNKDINSIKAEYCSFGCTCGLIKAQILSGIKIDGIQNSCLLLHY